MDLSLYSLHVGPKNSNDLRCWGLRTKQDTHQSSHIQFVPFILQMLVLNLSKLAYSILAGPGVLRLVP